MSKDQHRETVAGALRALGYEVEPIPEGTGESADLWAHSGNDQLVVEVKSRVDDLDVDAELTSFPKEAVSRDSVITRTDALGRLVRKARNQIEASRPMYPGLAILWFQENPLLGSSAAAEQMMGNLLGMRWVSFKHGDRFGFSRAFLVTRTDFHRYPELDGAVIGKYKKGLTLLANPYSTNAARLRSTRLGCYFVEHGAFTDLETTESTEGHFILRSDVDRADEAATLAALMRQHPDYRFMFSDLHAFAGYVRINVKDLE